MKKAAILLAPGFEEVEAVTPIDFMRRAGIEVVMAGVGGVTVDGGHGIVIQADRLVSDLDSAELDALVLPGGLSGADNLAADRDVRRLIAEMDGAGKLIAAICAAPAVVLEPAGILDGKKVTCYPGFEERFGAGIHFSDERVVQDGQLITSRGPGTAAEFALALVARLAGEEQARQLHEGTLQK